MVLNFINGDIREEWMPVAIAVEQVMRNPDNGVAIRSARIDFAGVYDEWGQSF